MSLRLAADTGLTEPFNAAVQFLTLEARQPDVEVVESRKLSELQYEIVDTMRWVRTGVQIGAALAQVAEGRTPGWSRL